MVGADKTTKLWRPPFKELSIGVRMVRSKQSSCYSFNVVWSHKSVVRYDYLNNRSLRLHEMFKMQNV